MKQKLLFAICIVFIAVAAHAQTPQAIPYQAVARDNAGNIIAGQNISLRFSIHDISAVGTVVYKETQSTTTNSLGLFSVNVGQGTPVTGTFAGIIWGTNAKFIQVEMDATGGITYVNMGTQQMLSVPYALLSGSSAGDWNLSGNAGTVDGTNFIGTTDNVPLNFRVNNQKAGRIDSTRSNTFFGFKSGNSILAGNNNTAVGQVALSSNGNGNNNTADGQSALASNIGGNFNTASGSYALSTNISGSNNTANGFSALTANTGSFNTADGSNALGSNTVGNQNTAIGYGAFFNNKGGSFAVAIGYQSQFYAYDNASGFNSWNTSVGWSSLRGSPTPANNTGIFNTSIGAQSLSNNTSGSYNTASGFAAMVLNTTGNFNTAAGYNSLLSNTSGSNNTAIGFECLDSNTTGIRNSAIGYHALHKNNIGDGNIAMGYNAVQSNTSGTNNIGVGIAANQFNVGGSYNTAIGYSAGVASASLNNTTAIGENAVVSASNTMVLGSSFVVGWGFGVAPGAAAFRVGTAATNGNGATLTLAGAWTNGSDSTKKCNIHTITYGLNEIMKLKPVSYIWKVGGQKDFGFLAQEVKNILPEIVFGEEGQMTISYGQITSVLTRAMQEQQAVIESLKAENEQLKADNNSFKSDISKIKAQLGMDVKAQK
jgi:hypothetical protein